MHEDIKRFSLMGEIGDANLDFNRSVLEHALECNMRDDGYVQVLDIEPQFTVDYQQEKDLYNFVLTLYGVFVGEAKAWEVAGIMGGKNLLRSTPPIR